jgi:protein TonB
MASKPGAGVSNEQFVNPSALWARKLGKHVHRYTRKTDWPGVVVVHMRINRQGKILSLNLQQSSGNEAFDTEVLTQVEQASPFPPPPAAIPGNILEFNLTIGNYEE